MAEFTALREKWASMKNGGKVFYYLFSKSGFTPEVTEQHQAGKVVAVTAEEIVKEDG